MAGISGNAKLDEFRAAMGICNLRHMDECITKRRLVAERYRKWLGNIPGLKLSIHQKNVTSNYAYFPVYFDEVMFGKTRDQVMQYLKENDIFSRKYFYPAINEMTCYKDKFDQNTPIAHDVSMHILTLPMYEELVIEDVDHICNIILG